MRKSNRFNGLWVLVVLTLCALPGFGQQTTGMITGTVMDSTGAVLTEAEVTLTNTSTNVTQGTRTNAAGKYTFSFVPPGNQYSLAVSAPGFSKFKADNIAVEVGKSTSLDAQLSLATVSDTVVVEASAVQVDTANSVVNTNIETKLIQDLPNFSRNSLEAAAIAPGVDLVNARSQVIGMEGSYATANGARRSQNSFYLDGAENSSAWRLAALQFPNPDTIQEVQVQTSNASAEFGKQPGATINAVTKSGTNEVHGTGFYFFRNQNLNANSWVNNSRNIVRPPDNQKYFGGTVGGPVFLPKLLDGRNRLFFFTSLSGFRDKASETQTNFRLPTSALKSGDFSEVPDFVDSKGKVIPFDIKDPATGLSLGKKLPANMINPVSKALLSLIPTSAGAYYDFSTRTYEVPTKNQEFLQKLDASVTPTQQASFSYMRTWGDYVNPSHEWANNNLEPWGGLQKLGGQTTLSGRHTWTARSNLVVETRFSLVQSKSDVSPTTEAKELKEFGAKWPFDAAPLPVLPGVRLEGSGGFRGDHANADYLFQRNYRFGGTAAWVTGSHTVRFGLERQYDFFESFTNRCLRNGFTFNGQYALNGTINKGQSVLSPNNFGKQNFAYAWADFLMGQVQSFFISGLSQTEFRYPSSYLFAQDEWKVSRNVTLNYGLRWELYGATSEANGKMGATLRPGLISSQFPNVPPGFVFDGDNGVPSGVMPHDNNNFAPRLGIAWDVTGKGKTALRAGIGLYYAAFPMAVRTGALGAGYGAPAPGGGNANLSDPYGTSKVNPYDTAYRYGPDNPPASPLKFFNPATYPWANGFTTQTVRGVPTTVYGGGNGFDPTLKTPYTTQFNVSLEQEIRSGFTANIGYVGNRSRSMPLWFNINAPLPLAGMNNSAQSALDRRPMGQYGNISWYQSRLNGSYNSLQAGLKFRLDRGLTGALNYVYAKDRSPFGVGATGSGASNAAGFGDGAAGGESIFDQNFNGQVTYPLDFDRDMAQNGRTHTMKANFVYDTPMNKAKSFWVRMAGAWTISGSAMAMSGIPLNVVWGQDANADGYGNDRPNLTGSISYPETVLPNGRIQYISKDAFVNGPCGTTNFADVCTSTGNLPRNAIWGVPVFNVNMALLKNFNFSERYRAQFRLESFNITNTNFLAAPISLAVNSADFGQINNRQHSPRRMQLGLKLFF